MQILKIWAWTKPYIKWFCIFFIPIPLIVLIHILEFGVQSATLRDDAQYTADVAVVFGARVFPDGRCSDALYDRTITACHLYNQGRVHYLLFSGGWDAYAPLSEPQAMRQIALQVGIPSANMILDEHGINTLATIQKAHKLAQQYGWAKLFMVSHDYHLARIQLFCEREQIAIIPIPAYERYTLFLKPYFIAREVAAWLYYFIGLE